MIKDSLLWEDTLKEQFEKFIQKVEIAKVPSYVHADILKGKGRKNGKTHSVMDQSER